MPPALLISSTPNKMALFWEIPKLACPPVSELYSPILISFWAVAANPCASKEAMTKKAVGFMSGNG